MTARRALVLDAGPLFEWLLVQTSQLKRNWPDQPQLHSISTIPSARAFSDVLLNSPDRVFTTPAVLTELHRRVQSADDKFRQAYWTAVVDMLARGRVRERGDLPLIAWPEELRAYLGRYGPTDVGLMALCFEVAHDCEEAVVVTDDRALRDQLREFGARGVSARDPRWLIQEVLGPDAALG